MKLTIHTDPDPILRQKAKNVSDIDTHTKKLIKAMEEYVSRDDAAGLAAPQVGESKRIIVCKYMLSDEEYTIIPMINPEILESSKETQSFEEACFSVPEVFEPITRSKEVFISFYDENMQSFTLKASDYNAQIIQHEIDHLNGVLFTDYYQTDGQKDFASADQK